MRKGETLQRLRLLLTLKQAEIAQHIPRYEGEGHIDDTTLSRIEAGHLEPTEAFVWSYLEALVEASSIVREDASDFELPWDGPPKRLFTHRVPR